MDRRRLDHILDDALDELDDDSSTSSSSTAAHPPNDPPPPERVVFGPPRPPPRRPGGDDDTGGDDPVDEMLRRMEALLDPSRTSPSAGEGPPPFVDPPSSATRTEMDETMNDLLKELSKPPPAAERNGGADGRPGPDLGGIGEEMMNEMASGFEEVLRGCSEGKDPSVDGAVDGMLRQLLGKDLMYRPMRDICDKFPEWLVEHEEGLSEEEYQRYGKQYQCFQRIVAVYETKPDDFDRLSELMHDIQEYGMPPSELIRELAPGLQFDEKGMPKMDAAMFAGTGLPGAAGLPFGGSDDAQCCTM